MNHEQPIFDLETHYRIEIQGQVDVEWLKGFDGFEETTVDPTNQSGTITVIKVSSDQSGIVGVVRRLHGLGMTILQVQVVFEGGKTTEIDVKP